LEIKMNNMENKHHTNDTKKMTYSSILVALLVVVSFLSNFPLFSMVSLAVAPIIIVLIHEKGGKAYTIMAFFVTAVLLSMFMNPIYGLTLTILNFCVGLGLIFMLEKKASPLVNFLVLMVSVAVGYMLMTYIDIKIIMNTSIVDFIALLLEEMKLAMVEGTKIYEDLGMDMTSFKANDMFSAMTVKSILTLIPTLIVFYAIMAATFIYKVSETVFRRMGIQVEPFPKFDQIKSNMFLVILTLSLSMIGVLGTQVGIGGAEGIMLLGNNLFIFVGIIGGLSLISYYMKTKLKYPVVIRAIMIFLILSSNLISIVVVAGILDSAFDFRTLTTNGLYQILKSKIKKTK